MKFNFKWISSSFLLLALFLVIFSVGAYADNFEISETIRPQYDEAERFSEDLAAVKKDEKWGYIDIDNNLVIDFDYYVAFPFSEGKALVGIEKLEKYDWSDTEIELIYWGIIDREGNYLGLKSNDGELFYNFKEDVSGYSDYSIYHNGILIIDFFDSPCNFSFDSKGMVIENGYGAYPLNEGILPVTDDGPKFIDFETGDTLFKDKIFYDIRPFNQGLAPVAIKDDSVNDPIWNLINRNGEILKDISFYKFYVMNPSTEHRIFNDNSLASVMNAEEKWGAIDKSGNIIIPFKYDLLKTFNEGLAGFNRNGKYGFVDVEGNEVIKASFDDVSYFNGGLAIVRLEDNAYFIDKNGNRLECSYKLPQSAYFQKIYNQDGSIGYRTFTPDKYMLIEEDSKYGFARVDYIPPSEEPENSLDFTEWEKRVNISYNKEWNIKFNSKIDESTLNTSNIYVRNSKGEVLDINLYLEETRYVVKVKPPKGGYENNKEYTRPLKKYCKILKYLKLKLIKQSKNPPNLV